MRRGLRGRRLIRVKTPQKYDLAHFHLYIPYISTLTFLFAILCLRREPLSRMWNIQVIHETSQETRFHQPIRQIKYRSVDNSNIWIVVRHSWPTLRPQKGKGMVRLGLKMMPLYWFVLTKKVSTYKIHTFLATMGVQPEFIKVNQKLNHFCQWTHRRLSFRGGGRGNRRGMKFGRYILYISILWLSRFCLLYWCSNTNCF